MFHQINELMVLGMHPAILYPRRSQIRPRRVSSERSPIVRHEAGDAYAAAGVQQRRPASSAHGAVCHWSCWLHHTHVRSRSAALTAGLPQRLQRPFVSIGHVAVPQVILHSGQYFSMT